VWTHRHNPLHSIKWQSFLACQKLIWFLINIIYTTIWLEIWYIKPVSEHHHQSRSDPAALSHRIDSTSCTLIVIRWTMAITFIRVPLKWSSRNRLGHQIRLWTHVLTAHGQTVLLNYMVFHLQQCYTDKCSTDYSWMQSYSLDFSGDMPPDPSSISMFHL